MAHASNLASLLGMPWYGMVWAQVSREFLSVLGAERLPYLQLVHQLIVCEESMHMEGAT